MSGEDVCGDQQPPFAQDMPGYRYSTCALPPGHAGLHQDRPDAPRIRWTHLDRDAPVPLAECEDPRAAS